MADEMQLIAHGEPQWDQKVNAAIKRLNEIGGGGHLSLNRHEQDGIVGLNGTNMLDTHYEVVPLNGVSIVSLYYSLSNTTIQDNALYSVDMLQLPDSIKPIGNYYGVQAFGSNGTTADKILYVTLSYGGKLTISAPFKLSKWLAYRGTFTYLTAR